MRLPVALAIAFALLIAGIAPDGGKAWAQKASLRDSRPYSAFADAIADVAEAARPSVVHIEATGQSENASPRLGPFGIYPQSSDSKGSIVHSLGSGVIFDARGYIVTNDHIVEHADTVYVRFFDGTERRAKVIGTDSFTDLAVLKVDGGKDLQPARFGDSESLRVGDWVVAIGSPSGLDWTVTAGIVSAKHRSNIGNRAPSSLEDFIQTDAPINPGNSGGPLLDLDGAVIGINSMIITSSQGSEGLAFAIPSVLARSVAAGLIEKGRVTRGDIGMYVRELGLGSERDERLPPGTLGALVSEVLPESPAMAAGMKAGDVVRSLGGLAVRSALDFTKAVSASVPGTKVRLEFLRDGLSRVVQVAVQDQAAFFEKTAARPDYFVLGIKVATIDEAVRSRMSLPGESGVIVTEVVSGSPASESSLEVNDIILGVGMTPVASEAEYGPLVVDAIKSGVVVLFLRDNRTGLRGFIKISLH
jgi:serine protease Do